MDPKSINFGKRALNEPVNKKAVSSFKLLGTSLKFQVTEFFNNSTLHGVRYIAEPGRPFGEKFMWFCLVSIGVVAAFVIIASLWEKFQTNPTITGLDTDFQNLQIFFPAVLVCPEKPFNVDRVAQLVEKLNVKDDPEKITSFLQKLTRLTYENMHEANSILSNISDIGALQSESLRTWMFAVGIGCQEIFTKCRYRGESFSCCDIFYPVYSERGLCYGFNARTNDTEDNEFKVEMFDLVETDKRWALTFDATLPLQVYILSFEENMGYDVHPQLQWNVEYYADILVSLKRTYTTEDTRQLTINQRKCIFYDEVQFQYYPQDKYTFTGCMKECRIKKCLQFCKCLPPFYKPKGAYRACNVLDMGCLAERAADITDIRDCSHCELACDITVFDIEKVIKTIKSEGSKETDLLINVEFLTWPIIQYKREVLFGWVDLLVSFGGIAGLFLGFSLLSGVEIIYYFTMRAVFMLYNNKEDLREIERKKLLRPPIKYDLGLKPTFGHRQRVVETPALKDGGTPTLQIVSEHPILSDGQIDRMKRLRKFDASNQKLKTIARKNMFKSVSVAPYSQNIKPLDERFKRDSDDPVFLGYLP